MPAFPRRAGTPRSAMTMDFRFCCTHRNFRVTGLHPITNAPAPDGGRAGVRGAVIFPPCFPLKKFYEVSPQASAGMVSAQVSTFVRIPSSEYEVRLTRVRLNVTMNISPFGSRHLSVAE